MKTKKKKNAARNESIQGEELLRFRCKGCGTCCKLWIPVTDEDVARLMAGTGLPPEKLVDFIEPSRFGVCPGTITWVKFGPGKKDRKAMCLREIRNQCLFLRANRCVAYEHRPLVCREHPFILTLDQTGRRIKTIELNQVCVCSHTLDGKMRKRDLKKFHLWSLRQDQRYAEKVRRWNRRKTYGDEQDFLRYLGLTDADSH